MVTHFISHSRAIAYPNPTPIQQQHIQVPQSENIHYARPQNDQMNGFAQANIAASKYPQAMPSTVPIGRRLIQNDNNSIQVKNTVDAYQDNQNQNRRKGPAFQRHSSMAFGGRFDGATSRQSSSFFDTT